MQIISTYKSQGPVLLIRRELRSGLTQALISEMAPKTMIDIDEDLDKEMKSFDRLQKALKRIKRELKRKSKSLRRELRTMYKKIVSIEKLKPKAPKSSRATSTKLMERNEANDGRKSKVLYKTPKGHEDPMEGENPSPNASHEDFFPDMEHPPNSSTKPTLLPNKSPENYEHDNQLKGKRSHSLPNGTLLPKK